MGGSVWGTSAPRPFPDTPEPGPCSALPVPASPGPRACGRHSEHVEKPWGTQKAVPELPTALFV